MNGLVRSLALALASAAVAIPPTASAQTDIVVTPRKPRAAAPSRPRPVRPKAAARATNGVLVVTTDVENAMISINGGAPESAGGDRLYQRELPANRDYRIRVTAGDDYEPFETTVRLPAREPKVVPVELRFKYGLLLLGPLLPNSTVALDGRPAERVSRDAERGVLQIDGVAPGAHEVVYEAPGYAPMRKRFQVEAGREYSYAWAPSKASVEVIVASEPGARVYVDGESKGEIPSVGRLRIADVAPGAREVHVSKAGYVDFKETRRIEMGAPVTVTARLTLAPSSAEFSDDFGGNTSQWVVPPAGIRLQKGQLAVEGAATPILVKSSYRDFEFSFYLTLKDGRGAAWVARAADASSYYLFYLSGPQGKFPNRFITYVVRNGAFDSDQYARSVPLSTKLLPQGKYTITVKARGNLIESFITPEDDKISDDAGVMKPLDVFRDSDSTFSFGSVGFRTVLGEAFLVDNVFVLPATK